MLKLKKYVYFNNLENEDLLFINIERYDPFLTLDDIFHKKSKALTPKHYHQLWSNAQKVERFIDQGINENVTSNKNIMTIFKEGFYLYNMDILQTNKEEIIYNIVAKDINNKIRKMKGDELKKLDLNYIKESIDLVSFTHQDLDLISILDSGYQIIEESKEVKTHA